MTDLSNSKNVALFLREKIMISDAEEFWVMALNCQCKLIEARMLFRGTVDQCFIHPRDVFRYGLLKNASFLVVGHNHPSGNCLPSREDLRMTKKLIALGKFIGIPVLDHVIIDSGSFHYYSFSGHSNSQAS